MATAEEAHKFLNTIMDQIDRAFNGPPSPPGEPRKIGLILIVFPTDAPPEQALCTITTNGVTQEYATEILKHQVQGLLEEKKLN